MEEIRHHDRYLDPPEEPTHWECTTCGVIFDGGDLEKISDDEWACKDCLKKHYTECAYCRKYVPNEEVLHHAGLPFCENCYDD